MHPLDPHIQIAELRRQMKELQAQLEVCQEATAVCQEKIAEFARVIEAQRDKFTPTVTSVSPGLVLTGAGLPAYVIDEELEDEDNDEPSV